MSFQLIPQAYAAASTWTGDCVGGSNIGDVDTSNVATITGIRCLIENLIRPLPGIIALVAVFMIIYAGIRIATAGPDAKAVASAWSTFAWAVIGLILLAAIWMALILIETFTGAKITDFGI